jgi:PhnB protein
MGELTPYLCVTDSRAAIEWYVGALGAEVTTEPIVMDDGRVGHCELAVGGARWMMADEHPEIHVEAPDPARGAAVTLHLTVDDCDAVAARVRQHGASLDRGPEDSPPVGRVAVFRDPFGHRWFVNQRLRRPVSERSPR